MTASIMKRRVGPILAVVVLCASATAQAQDEESYALMVQVSPPEGGRVTPSPGIHKIPVNEAVSLSAVPAPGYRFLYWLGDVSNPDAMQTTTVIGGPKIVVAMFQRTQFDMLPTELGAADSSDRGARLVGQRLPLPGTVGFSAGAAPQTAGRRSAQSNVQPIDWNDWIPGPGTGDNGSSNDQSGDQPVPEPTTMGLLALGAALLGATRRRRASPLNR